MKYAVGLLAVLVLVSCSQKPPPYVSHADTVATTAGADSAVPPAGPLTTALQGEITQALQATDWPPLDPSMESVITGPTDGPEIVRCVGTGIPDPDHCTWGSPTAGTRIVVVGDSVALSYVATLREIALHGQIQVHTEAMPGCAFADDIIRNDGAQDLVDACPGRKQHAVDLINTTKPDVVIISNAYVKKPVANGRDLTPGGWAASMKKIVETFRPSTTKVVFLAAPPDDVNIGDCYSKQGSTPTDCVSRVTGQWMNMAAVDQHVAAVVGGIWVDSRPWFCSGKLCPSFVGSTPTKHDAAHMSPAYAEKIFPVVAESLSQAGVF